jgi:hypothetical protein
VCDECARRPWDIVARDAKKNFFVCKADYYILYKKGSKTACSPPGKKLIILTCCYLISYTGDETLSGAWRHTETATRTASAASLIRIARHRHTRRYLIHLVNVRNVSKFIQMRNLNWDRALLISSVGFNFLCQLIAQVLINLSTMNGSPNHVKLRSLDHISSCANRYCEREIK